MKKIDESGNRYGMLTVLKECGKKYKQIAWQCLCDCGNQTIVAGDNLRKGNTTSCGCYRLQQVSLNLTNKKFGFLTAIARTKVIGKSGWGWLCKCDCGNQKEVRGSALFNGITVSCGCQSKGPNFPVRPNHIISRSRHHGMNRRAREKRAGGRLPKGVKEFLSLRQRQNCAICECYIEHGSGEVDHIVPLAKGGSNELENVQLLCRTCNRSKGAR
jgi:5-methylcytosine-specific restriction endonuclease McrA